MGLAASQARLLSITSRKSDCELASMRLSHQKIALSRDLTDLSNEYQNSLNQTKLYYDFYGKNDKSTQLSYGILMNPSALNEYLPILITDTTGRAILDSKLAAAARGAGIPQEGLGCLPSTEMRTKFIAGLFDQGIITYEQAQGLYNTTYNQKLGLGGTNGITIDTEFVTMSQLAQRIRDMEGTDFDFAKDEKLPYINPDNATGIGWGKLYDCPTNSASSKKYLGEFEFLEANDKGGMKVGETNDKTSLNLADILEGNYILEVNTEDGDHGSIDNIAEYLTNMGYWDFMIDTFSQLLGIEGQKDYMLEYATSMLAEVFSINNFASDDTNDSTKHKDDEKYASSNKWVHRRGSDGHKQNVAINGALDKIGYSIQRTTGKNRNSHGAINLSTMTRAFLTYFKQLDNDGFNGNGKYFNIDETSKKLDASTLVDKDTEFEIVRNINVDEGTQQLAVFYDTLFNQLCTRGWTENNNITDPTYLQNILQNGTGFITKSKDDGYYYQGNYATDTYIKEVSDDTLIARAEAKYKTEKQKINQKEQEIDLKMKNLDTEISSLTTEYDTVKNVLSKNIEKVFKRYNA